MTMTETRRRGPGSQGAQKGWETRYERGYRPGQPGSRMGRPKGSGGSDTWALLTKQYEAQGTTLRQVLIDKYNEAGTQKGAARLMGITFVTYRILCEMEGLGVKVTLGPVSEPAA